MPRTRSERSEVSDAAIGAGASKSHGTANMGDFLAPGKGNKITCCICHRGKRPSQIAETVILEHEGATKEFPPICKGCRNRLKTQLAIEERKRRWIESLENPHTCAKKAPVVETRMTETQATIAQQFEEMRTNGGIPTFDWLKSKK
jgi:hypothetical protein